jgi:hypothetical protein
MKKRDFLGVILFGSLWGCAEAVLGGVFYAHQVPYGSVLLGFIAFALLSWARVRYPQAGTSTLMGTVAMLYKFANQPFFACHLLAILLIGASYDLVFSLRFKRGPQAVAATYLGRLLFALTITYVFRYHYWVEAGFARIVHYVGVSGSLMALANLVAVPLWYRWAEGRKGRGVFLFRPSWTAGAIALLWTVALFVRI